MAIRFASLGSGSKGNALLVESGRTRILLDCGFAPRELVRRLERLDVEPESVSAVLVTHEHADHAGGVARCAARFGWQVRASHGTAQAAQLADVAVKCFDSHSQFGIDDLEVHPYPVPHDAREPTQFVFSDGNVRLGVLTDTGTVTPHIRTMLADCAALVIECNHDLGMLEGGRYPPLLKRRIAGNYGHLDNLAAADLLRTADRDKLRHVVAAHLSEENNTPQLARQALAGVLGCNPEWIGLADQANGSTWRQI